MGRMQALMIGAMVFFTSAIENVEAYGSYIPIRPAKPMVPYIEPEPYTHPGVMFLRGDTWEGHDNLNDLPSSIRIVTEIINDPQYDLWLPCQQAQAELEKDLKCVGIDVRAPALRPEDSYRPFLHLLIFVTQCSEGNAVHISLRLFEMDHTFKRGDPKTPEVWQVITWEKQATFFAPTGRLICSVREQVAALSDQFTRRYVLERQRREAAQKGVVLPSKGAFSNNPPPPRK